jgi:hypothetical protein
LWNDVESLTACKFFEGLELESQDFGEDESELLSESVAEKQPEFFEKPADFLVLLYIMKKFDLCFMGKKFVFGQDQLRDGLFLVTAQTSVGTHHIFEKTSPNFMELLPQTHFQILNHSGPQQLCVAFEDLFLEADIG